MTLDQLEFSTYCIDNVADDFGIDDREAYDIKILKKSGFRLWEPRFLVGYYIQLNYHNQAAQTRLSLAITCLE